MKVDFSRTRNMSNTISNNKRSGGSEGVWNYKFSTGQESRLVTWKQSGLQEDTCWGNIIHCLYQNVAYLVWKSVFEGAISSAIIGCGSSIKAPGIKKVNNWNWNKQVPWKPGSRQGITTDNYCPTQPYKQTGLWNSTPGEGLHGVLQTPDWVNHLCAVSGSKRTDSDFRFAQEHNLWCSSLWLIFLYVFLIHNLLSHKTWKWTSGLMIRK